jgi:hypothetical protein
MSFTFANLPGVQVDTIDGGLAAVNTPTTQTVMVFGTSAIGPANSPYQVISLATAAKTFGLNGTLIRGMSEVAAYCDNIILFRIGANQGSITVGATNAGSASVGTMAYAYSNAAGTLYTFVTTGLGDDVVAGALVTTSGFTGSAFNIGPLPIASVNAVVNSFTVVISPPAIPTGGLESFALAASPNASIVANLATIYATNVVGQVINVGDSITVATATSATLDIVGATVLSSALVAGVWKITYTSPTTTLAPTSQAAGTAVDNSVIAASVEGTASVTVPANVGNTITLGQIDATANTRYSIWYDGGIVTLWLDNVVVYSNDPSINVNTGDSQATGAAVGGLLLNNAVGGNPDTLANAITLQAAAALTTVGVDLAPVYVAPLTGIGLTNRQLYIAQQNAMNLARGLPIDIAVTPNAYADNPNVAYYVSSNTATVANNPVTNPNALDWLWTGVDVNGNAIYQWASEAQFWTSNTQAVSTAILLGQSVATTPIAHASPQFTSATTRLGDGVGSGNLQPLGFHEVSFAYQLARFCAAQSEAPQADNGGCLGFIGTNGPANLTNFSLSSVHNWIGFLPTYGVSGTGTTFAVTSGAGLLGIPFLVGASSSTMNQACADFANGFRVPGLFATVSGEYDGGPTYDVNGYPVQIGAYLSVQGDYVLQANGYGTYVGNMAGIVAGEVSSLDQLKAITNKQVAGVSQLYRASVNQLDALTFANVNVMRYKGQGAVPVALHDKTAATVASDYTLTLRQRIKFLMIQTLLAEANNFIGNGTNDGLSLVALKTVLDTDCMNLQKRGYVSSYNFTITSTLAQQKAGQASIQISFVPADELVQLRATIGINLKG